MYSVLGSSDAKLRIVRSAQSFEDLDVGLGVTVEGNSRFHVNVLLYVTQ